MKSLIVFLAIIGFAISACPGDTRAAFISFKRSFARKYNSSSDEENKYGVFRKNLIEIEAHNARYKAGLETYSKGVDQFTDMTTEEFQASLTSEPLTDEVYDNITYYQAPARSLQPASLDYRKRGACNRVTNQRWCRSSWAHATVGCLESHIFLRTGKLPRLSVEHLMGCDKTNYGCSGGSTLHAFDYIAKNGIATEDNFFEYKYYTVSRFTCIRLADEVDELRGWKMVYPQDEDLLEVVVNVKGPVAVRVDASEWNGYRMGIFETTKRKYKLNHNAVIIGYGEQWGIKYWLIRNSFGEEWGQKGHIKIRRGINQIGIAQQGIFPDFPFKPKI